MPPRTQRAPSDFGVGKARPPIGRPVADGYYRLYEQDVFRIIHTFADQVATQQQPATLQTFKQIFADNYGWFLFAVCNSGG